MKQLDHFRGGDRLEAVKTSLVRAYELIRVDAMTIIFLYTDALLYTFTNRYREDLDSCLGPELKALQVESWYRNFGPYFQD